MTWKYFSLMSLGAGRQKWDCKVEWRQLAYACSYCMVQPSKYDLGIDQTTIIISNICVFSICVGGDE